MNRRNVLKIAGGGVVLAATGGAIWAATRTPNAALAPWAEAGAARYTDARLNALSYAILAPNPHNRQPWMVALDGEDSVTLYFDTDRQLPHTDPFDRQLTIGLGCFLELMEMAANADGYRVDATLFPEGEDAAGLDARPIAHVRFTADANVTADPLWPYVLHRRSLKEPFDTERPVPAASLANIIASGRTHRIGGTIDPDEVAEWRRLSSEALVIEIETPATYLESVELFRIGKAEINANPDGIDFPGPMMEALNRLRLFTREGVTDPESFGFQQGIAAVLANTETAMGHVWMVSDGNTRVDQINAGRDWLRVNLACAVEGLGFQPLSQALQEYPEMEAHYADTHARLAPEGGTVQMLARIGYGPDVPVSPRWPLEAKLVDM